MHKNLLLKSMIVVGCNETSSRMSGSILYANIFYFDAMKSLVSKTIFRLLITPSKPLRQLVKVLP
jgi:hypothetical protein